MKYNLLKYFKKLRNYSAIISILCLILATFIVNTFHTQFPDEFDNIYGGFLIDSGKLPYLGFFTHHNPGAYFLASLITLISGRSFVTFRIIFSLVLFIFFIASYIFLKMRIKNQRLSFFLFYGLLVGFGATYWWGQMLLSETVVSYLLVPVFLLLILKKISKIKFDTIDLWFISILTFLSIFISLTYIYLIPFVDFLAIYYYFIDNRQKDLKKVISPFLIFLSPYAVFFIYLLVTGSLREFYFDSIYYNVQYYIYNFPKVGEVFSHNPIRYGISIAKNTLYGFSALLTNVSSFNFSYPLNISLALADVSIIIYFVLRRYYSLAILVFWMILYTNARSEPLNIKETDFHATVFIMITISLLSFLLFKLKEELNQKLPEFERLILSFIFILTGAYWFFTTIFLANGFVSKAYGKYMGHDPLIYDNSQVAPILNKIVSADEYYWIGPFELQELLFIKGKIASKYFWFLPADARDEKIKSEITADLLKNRPKVIVFKKWWANFGVTPQQFNSTIVNILDQNYFQLADLRKEGLRFKVTAPKERNFDFENEYFFDKARKEEIVKQLFVTGLIEKI